MLLNRLLSKLNLLGVLRKPLFVRFCVVVLGIVQCPFNRPFPSSKKSHFQNEAKCETFVVKMSFICIIIKNHFHINGFALSLALKVRFFGTRKWPILGLQPHDKVNTIEFFLEEFTWK